eukprot:TRINITY_DN2928_c0_g1_i1.p1 TRINITY_DN2928_c0_g1~~TRINITY_DN2928_c0_g1_i1.p1  ORF type:complete len:215 (+),score=32.50 TRINITY_DN2928_c0_g1_i1:41-646(+)
MKILIVVALLFCVSAVCAYDRSKAMAYVNAHWNSPNHNCGGAYDSCSPYQYWGQDHCGYPSHGGNCANFVSQVLVESGHPKLSGSSVCRGFCGSVEVGAKNLGDCLSQHHGWKKTCGLKQGPPAGVQLGDVIIFHAGGCDGFTAHAVVVSGVSMATNGTNVIDGVTVACNSPDEHHADWSSFLGNHPYAEWLTGGPHLEKN